MENTPQIRHWCFTWYDDAWPTWIPDKMHYLVYQVEICPETNRFHIQGYVEFKRSQRLNSAKKLLKTLTAHLEPRQGSRDQARAYCMKEESRAGGEHAGPWEYGEWTTGAEKRSEIQLAVESIKSGAEWPKVLEDFTGVAVRHYKNLFTIWNHFNLKPRDGEERVHNVYIYGTAGVGKTRFAHWLCRYFNQVPYTGYIRSWWENYLGQEWALYDDFDGAVHMDIGSFKKVCDRYGVRVACKGGSAEYRASVNIFTSNIYPIDWYDRVHWDAVRRRASHLIWWRAADNIQCEKDHSEEEGGRCRLLELIAEFQLYCELDIVE